MAVVLSLRERKKALTRRRIQTAALELVAEKGWAATTISAIAGAAEVAPRTVSAYFPSKVDIVIPHPPDSAERLEAILSDDDLSVVDGLKRWLVWKIENGDNELAIARLRAIKADPELLAHDRASWTYMEGIVARAAGRRYRQPPDAMGPRMVGACLVTLLLRFREYADSPLENDYAAASERGFEMLERAFAAIATPPAVPGAPDTSRFSPDSR